jgi:hypothetical protein
MLLNLWDEGFYKSNPGRPHMNWLRKSFPLEATEEFTMS